MVLNTQEAEIVLKFCDRFEGREQEIGSGLIVFGELQMIADEMNITVHEVAAALAIALKEEETNHLEVR